MPDESEARTPGDRGAPERRFDALVIVGTVLAVAVFLGWQVANPRPASDGGRPAAVARALDHKALVNDENFHIFYGMAYGQAGLLEQAIFEEKEALRVNPRSASALNNLGFYCSEKGRYAEAAQALERALVLDPRSDYVRNNLRNTYLKAVDAAASEDEKRRYRERREKLEAGALPDFLKQAESGAAPSGGR